MAKEWYLKTKPIVPNSLDKDGFDYYAQGEFASILDTYMAQDIEVYNTDLSVMKMTRGVVQSLVSNNKIKYTSKTILYPIGTIEAGQYVKLEGKYWIVTNLVDNNRSYEKAIISLCQYLLKWQNDKGEIVERWTTLSSAYLSNDNNNIISLEDNSFLLGLPVDNETLELDTHNRFFITKSSVKRVYRVVGINDIEHNYDDNGYLNVKVEQDVFKPDVDNFELRICNYWKNNNTPPIVLNKYIQLDYKGTNIYAGGNKKTITANLYDNGQVVVGVIYNWTINSDIDKFIIKTISDNKLELKVLDDKSVYNKPIKITVEADGTQNELELLVNGW